MPSTLSARLSRLSRPRFEAQLRPWYVAGLMCACYVVAFLDRALVGVAGKPIKHDLALSDSQFGLLQGMAFAALYCLCGIPLGWLADRVARPALIAVALLVWTAMTAACGLAKSFDSLFAARVGVGFAEASLVPAGVLLLGSVFPREKLARAVAVFLAGATLGNAVALLGGGWLLDWFAEPGHRAFPVVGTLAPWRALFLVACPPGILLAGLVLMIREPTRVSRTASPWQELKDAARHLQMNAAAYASLTGAAACVVMAAQATSGWMPLFYARHFNLPGGESATLVGAMFLISAPTGQWFGGLLIDRLRMRGVAGSPTVVLASCAALSPLPATIFCLTGHLWVAEAGYALFNFLIFAATPAGLAGWQLLTPERHRGVTTALLGAVVTFIGVGLGSAAIGWITDGVFHDEQALGQSLWLEILAAGSAAGVLGLLGRAPFAAASDGVRPHPVPRHLQAKPER